EQLARAGNAAKPPTPDMTIEQTARNLLASKPLPDMTIGDLDVVAQGTGIPIETLKQIARGMDAPIQPPAPIAPAASGDPVVQLPGSVGQRLLEFGKYGLRHLFVDPIVDFGVDSKNVAYRIWKIAYPIGAIIVIGTNVISRLRGPSSSGDGGGDAATGPINPTGPTGLDLGDPNQATPAPNTTLNVVDYIRTPDDRHKLLRDLTPDSVAGNTYGSDGRKYLTSDQLAIALTDPSVRQRLLADGFNPDVVLNWLTDPQNWALIYDKTRQIGGQNVVDEDSLAAYLNSLPNH
ncbi:MAG: hypothetical protein HYX67_15090, partial [Candidatus Melainabacteria bacterium]|nr:hypothetical protein [Candidatus Melainabacteria bacterium]